MERRSIFSKNVRIYKTTEKVDLKKLQRWLASYQGDIGEISLVVPECENVDKLNIILLTQNKLCFDDEFYNKRAFVIPVRLNAEVNSGEVYSEQIINNQEEKTNETK